MGLRNIQIVVKEDGSVQTNFVNFTGADCLAEGQRLHALLEALGIQEEQTAFLAKPELLLARQGYDEMIASEQPIQMEDE